MPSDKSICMVDNIRLENYVKRMLNIYFPFAKPSSHLDMMTCLGYHITVMPKYSTADSL